MYKGNDKELDLFHHKNGMFPFQIVNGLQFYLGKAFHDPGFMQISLLSNPFYFVYQVYGEMFDFMCLTSEYVIKKKLYSGGL